MIFSGTSPENDDTCEGEPMAKNSCDWEPESLKDLPCDWQPRLAPVSGDNQSALYKFTRTFGWQGVDKESFRKEGSDIVDVVRHVIIGNRGESCRFALRYFELAPGVETTREEHPHEHVLICVRGRGKAVIGEVIHPLAPLDTLYITGNDPHRLVNEGPDPFGFFCIVNAERTGSAPVLDEELQWLQESAPGATVNWTGEPNR